MFLSNVFEDVGSILAKEEYVNWILQGLAGTVVIALIGTIGGLLIGIFLAFGKRLVIENNSPWYHKLWKYPLRWLATGYSVIVRGTPMMVQALLFQQLFLLFGVNFNNIWNDVPVFNGWFLAGSIIIVLNTTAYMGEIIIAGLNGIGQDQIEGAKALGMNDFQILMHVTLPQAIKNSIPTIGNELIVNIKDSSVLNVISVTELFFQAKTIAGKSYKYMAIYLIIAACYLLLTLLATAILKLVSMKLEGKKINWSFFHYSNPKMKGD